MSLGGRYLHVGDYALTDFNGPGPMTRIEVIKVAGGCDVYRVTVVESSWK